jgi:histidinol-phosphate aminotransferase
MTKLLRHHGDLDAAPGLVDLAVNLRPGTPPAWLRDLLADVDLANYPDQAAARAAVATRHGVGTDEVLLTAGAAEAFVLIARAIAPRRALVVHPQFTEPEHALRSAGHEVEQLVLDPPFVLDAHRVPDDVDLVVIGNPTNPTSVLHPAGTIRSLVRPGRLVVVDEAFADCVPGEPESLIGEQGVLVVRSLTKTWGLAGLRVGYVIAEPDVVAGLSAAQPHWPVSSPALAACVACCTAAALEEAEAWAATLTTRRRNLAQRLSAIAGVEVVAPPRASFLLVHVPVAEVWNLLRGKGFAVRRGDTFPGLGPEWIRVAVRDDQTSADFARTLTEVLR